MSSLVWNLIDFGELMQVLGRWGLNLPGLKLAQIGVRDAGFVLNCAKGFAGGGTSFARNGPSRFVMPLNMASDAEFLKQTFGADDAFRLLRRWAASL